MADEHDLLPEIEAALLGTCILPREKPPHVYHYTTIEGLAGILSTGRIWATDLSYTNDSSEYSYADRLCEEVAASLGGGLLAGALGVVLRIDPREGFDVYASCFCESGDLLSQWRAYANFGTGYAIEFELPALESRLRELPSVLFGKVEYDEKRQRELLESIMASPAVKGIAETHNEAVLLPIVREILTRVVAEASGESALDKEELNRRMEAAKPEVAAKMLEEISRRVSDVVPEVLSRLIVCRAFLKSPFFGEEHEWRVVVIRAKAKEPKDLEFRRSRDMLVPYLPLNLLGENGQLPISRIVIGPTVQPRLAKRALEDFLRSRGQEHIAYSGPCRSPFRADGDHRSGLMPIRIPGSGSV